jgi:ribosomal protein S18 acetylase RimI-like enzyme
VWGIDWSAHLPRVLTDDGVRVAYSSYDRALPFLAKNLALIFEEDPASSPFAQKTAGEAKARYYRQMADFFEFDDHGTIAGYLICTPIDWSSYYLRLAAMLPEYQGRKLAQRFFPQLFDILQAAGVERIEAETSPSNMAVMHNMTRMRFNVTGTVLSERWGSLVRLTKFLDGDAEGVFLRQFCAGIQYQTRGNSPARDEKGGTP